MESFSKAMSRLLRHDVNSQGLNVDENQYILLTEVYSVNYIKRYNPTLSDFMEVANTRNNRNQKRFDLKKINGKYKIKATYLLTYDKNQET